MSTLVVSPAFLLTGFAGGIAIGLTGMGGGAVLTPVLLTLGVPPSAAVGSDLLASLFIKPVAGWVHSTAKTVRWDIVRWLTLGSVPAALAGSLLSSRLTGHGEGLLKQVIGATLLIAAMAMFVRAAMARKAAASEKHASSAHADVSVAVSAPHSRVSLDALPTSPNDRRSAESARPLQSVALGIVGGLLVGLTSVGSGSLMVVFLTLIYPKLAPKALVGTDIVQAIPLVAAAAFGHVLMGNVRFGLTAALLIGGIPGAYIGAMLSSGRATRIVRPVLITLLMATGTKLVMG
jgi:uncharacterized protein